MEVVFTKELQAYQTPAMVDMQHIFCSNEARRLILQSIKEAHVLIKLEVVFNMKRTVKHRKQ